MTNGREGDWMVRMHQLCLRVRGIECHRQIQGLRRGNRWSRPPALKGRNQKPKDRRKDRNHLRHPNGERLDQDEHHGKRLQNQWRDFSVDLVDPTLKEKLLKSNCKNLRKKEFSGLIGQVSPPCSEGLVGMIGGCTLEEGGVGMVEVEGLRPGQPLAGRDDTFGREGETEVNFVATSLEGCEGADDTVARIGMDRGLALGVGVD